MKPLLIGIGNPFRADDNIGIEVVRFLEKKLGTLVDTAYCNEDMIKLLETWEKRGRVFLVDAVQSGQKEIGFVHKFDPCTQKIPAVFTQTSTHLLDVAAVIELAQALKDLPEYLVLYGIEAKNFSFEKKISWELREKFTNIANRIEEDILNILYTQDDLV